ncbi:MAG: HD domain-containing protein [Acidimicrobiia bacterium]|nr:HD domain-containing protein [Acidimicrobiia bacterium]
MTSIDDVLALFEAHGDDRYDEELSQRDHARQTAALALAAGADDALVVAALLHDIGHLLDLAAGGTADVPRLAHHERVGAIALSELFDESVTAPIALHVEAKRYLTAVDPDLVDRLSNGSRTSLGRQGGPMDETELEHFRTRRWFAEACALRRWDDDGKVDGLVVPPLSAHRSTLERVARPQP